MRISRSDGTGLRPEDVAWVVEWQLTACLAWLPLVVDEPVLAAAEPEGPCWRVVIHTGCGRVFLLLPLRDLERVIGWAHRSPTYDSLRRPPAPVRGSILALRAVMRTGLARLNPLEGMGYGSRRAGGVEPSRD